MLSVAKKKSNAELIGAVVRSRRIRKKMTQRDLANALGLNYYNFISQIELGHATLPPALWRPISATLDIDSIPWILLCLSTIHPEVYSALFHDEPVGKVASKLRRLNILPEERTRNGSTPEL